MDIIPKCESCFDGVCREPKLLADGDWTIGPDGRYHWARHVGDTAVNDDWQPIVLGVCGARVLEFKIPRG